jgi:hypothetical protein
MSFVDYEEIPLKVDAMVVPPRRALWMPALARHIALRPLVRARAATRKATEATSAVAVPVPENWVTLAPESTA